MDFTGINIVENKNLYEFLLNTMYFNNEKLADDIVIEYYELLKQLDIVYKNMEDTYNTGQDPYNPYNPFSYKKRRKGN